jgi:hypothetical protein
MANVSVSKQLQVIFGEISGKLMKRVVTKTLNKTAQSVRAEIVRSIRSEVAIKAGDLRKRVYARNVSRTGAPSAVLSSFVVVYPRGIPLIDLGARPKVVRTMRGKRIGVTAMVGGTRKPIPGGFIATTRSGNRGVFVRKGDTRLPIKQLYSSEISEHMNKPTFQNNIDRFAIDRFETIFDQEFRFANRR